MKAAGTTLKRLPSFEQRSSTGHLQVLLLQHSAQQSLACIQVGGAMHTGSLYLDCRIACSNCLMVQLVIGVCRVYRSTSCRLVLWHFLFLLDEGLGCSNSFISQDPFTVHHYGRGSIATVGVAAVQETKVLSGQVSKNEFLVCQDFPLAPLSHPPLRCQAEVQQCTLFPHQSTYTRSRAR